MNQIKSDLICEIIRISQTNFLGRKRGVCGANEAVGNEDEVVSWIKENAAAYRQYFRHRLDSCPTKQLSDILKQLSESQKDLSEILGIPPFCAKQNPWVKEANH